MRSDIVPGGVFPDCELPDDPMIPHALVLKPRLVIHSVYNGYWFWGRPSVEDLRQQRFAAELKRGGG